MQAFVGCRDALNCNLSKIAGARTRSNSCVADSYGKLDALIAAIGSHCFSGTYIRKTRRMFDPCGRPIRPTL